MCIKVKSDRREILSILSTVFFVGAHFIEIQCFEYIRSVLSFRDSIYGCLFFSITGLHLFHVVIGMLLILLSGLRISNDPYIIENGLNPFLKTKNKRLDKLLNNKLYIKENIQ